MPCTFCLSSYDVTKLLVFKGTEHHRNNIRSVEDLIEFTQLCQYNDIHDSTSDISIARQAL